MGMYKYLTFFFTRTKNTISHVFSQQHTDKSRVAFVLRSFIEVKLSTQESIPNCKILELGEHFAQVPKNKSYEIRKRHAQQNINIHLKIWFLDSLL